jgi:RNA polymerase sigma factor (sigma-70 family)
VLGDVHEAEDAAQAAFLVLAKKAAAIRRPDALAAWLHTAARHLALVSNRAAARRREREMQGFQSSPALARPDPLDKLTVRELLGIVDEELQRLPEVYRLPLILCCLEGRTQEEAARQLGWTPGSVKGRLERGRARLHKRLVKRGLTLPAALSVLEVSRGRTPAVLDPLLLRPNGRIPPAVEALMEEGMKGMAATKARVVLVLLAARVIAAGVGLIAHEMLAVGQPKSQQAAQPNPEAKRADAPKEKGHAPTDFYGDPLPAGAIARLGTVRFRHGGFLSDALISPDGRQLFSVGDHSVEWWDAQNGSRQRQIVFSNPNYRGAGLDLSPDGKLLAVHFQVGGKMRFWDTASDAEVYPFGDSAPDRGRAKFSPRGNLLAQLENGNQRTVSIWDVRKGKKIRTIEGGESGSSIVRSLAFSPNGNLLAFPRATGVCVWDLVADKELYYLDPGAKTAMGCVVFSADGKLLAGATNPYKHGPDHAIHLWDMATGKEVGALKGHEDGIKALAMSPKDNLLASASFDNTIRFWDLAKRQEIGRSPGPGRHTDALSFSADGSVLASGDYFGALRLWDARKFKEISIPSAGSHSVEWIHFAPDGQTPISTVTEQIGLWEPLTGRSRQLFHNKYLFDRHPALSPDGKSLAKTSDRTQGQALLWDVATGKLVRRFGEGGPARISSITFSPDGRRVAGGSFQQDIIRVWEAASGKELLQLKGQSKPRALAFTPDGTKLVSASFVINGDNMVRLCNLATGEEIWRKVVRPWTAYDLAFSADGRTLALVEMVPGRSTARGEVHLWESATGKELKQFEGHRGPVLCVAFSADGRMLATGSYDNTVRLWEVASGRERQCFQGHQNVVLAVSFSPDGRLLASASGDTTALVWDLTGHFRGGRYRPRRLSSEELDRCWNDLGHADAARAYQSIIALTGSPKEAVALLKDRLSPVTVAEPKRVAPLLAALGSDQFAERDKAITELEKLGLAAEPALREALNAKPSLETRRRIEAILEKLASGPRLRLLRALEVLEHIGTAEARQMLESLSRGPAELWPTQEAKASLERLAKRQVAKP